MWSRTTLHGLALRRKREGSKSLNASTGDISEPGGKVAFSGKINPEHSFSTLLMNSVYIQLGGRGRSEGCQRQTRVDFEGDRMAHMGAPGCSEASWLGS